MLTCLIQKPKRLIYLTSDMHRSGHPKLDCFTSNAGEINYSDSKLHVLMLCKAVARKWADVYANAVNPGWVPTKMGGSHAPDDLKKGYETQAWLAASDDQQAKVSGCYFFHQKQRNYNPIANDIMLQEAFLSRCRKITEIALD
jgi:NAD(P)-dependent dehydrogenase (short-subunit alcohol dehydrogenase family)